MRGMRARWDFCGGCALAGCDFCGGCALAVGFLLGMCARGPGCLREVCFAWDILGYLGISWDILGYPGISWDILGYPGISWDILGYPGITWGILGYMGGLAGNRSPARGLRTRLRRASPHRWSIWGGWRATGPRHAGFAPSPRTVAPTQTLRPVLELC